MHTIQTNRDIMLDIDGALYETRALLEEQSMLHTAPLFVNGARVVLAQNQPVYCMQAFEDGRLLFVLLRYMQQGAQNADVFRILHSTFLSVLAADYRVPVEGVCDVTMFSTYDREESLFFAKVPIADLSETGIGLVVPKKLHHSTFAECTFSLHAEQTLRLSCRTTHSKAAAEQYHVGFEFLDISEEDRLRIREYLFMQQAQGLRSS